MVADRQGGVENTGDTAGIADADFAIFMPACSNYRTVNNPQGIANNILCARCAFPACATAMGGEGGIRKMAMALQWRRCGRFYDILELFWRWGDASARM